MTKGNIARSYPANIYLLKIENTRKRYEKCLKLIIKTPERCHCRHSGVFMITFEHISQAFTNSWHSYNRVRNVHANGVTHARKLMHVIDSSV